MSPCTSVEGQRIECPTIDLATLNLRGWTSSTVKWTSERNLRIQISSMARQIGKAVPTRDGRDAWDELELKRSAFAQARSLSKIHDLGEFPLHNDTAHWVTPCHYLILACVRPGHDHRPTLLMDTNKRSFNSDDEDLLRTAPFRIRNGRKSFFSTILSKDRPFVRFDRGCMVPTCSYAEEALDLYSRREQRDCVEVIQWEKGKIVVIDNWRVLHGRDAGDGSASSRRLLRVSIV